MVTMVDLYYVYFTTIFFLEKRIKTMIELKNQLTKIKGHLHSQLRCLPEQSYKAVVLALETQVSQTTENCDTTNTPPQTSHPAGSCLN